VHGASSKTGFAEWAGSLRVSGRHGASAGSEGIVKLRAGTMVSVMQ